MEPRHLQPGDLVVKVGDVISSAVYEIWAVVGNTDTQEGRGTPLDLTYCSSQNEAVVLSKGRGVMGGDALVERRLALSTNIFLNGNQYYVLIPVSSFIQLRTDVYEIAKRRREEILAKLSPADRAVLGL